MKILSLHIDGFGKLHDQDISFQDGMNVVYGKNEAGKSTLHTFIKGMPVSYTHLTLPTKA